MYVKAAHWLIVFVFTAMTPVCWGQDEGQADLDKATELQLQVKSLTDVEKVIELCESAIEKGLDEDNTAFAKQLLVSSLWQHSTQLTSAIFDNPRPHPRWPAIRSLSLKNLKKLLTHDPNFADAHMLMAKLQSLPRGDRKAGFESAEKAIELYKDDKAKRSAAIVQRARLRNEKEEQLKDLDLAVEVDPSNAEAWQMRAAFYVEKGELESAIESFQKILESDSDNIAVHQAIAEAFNNLKKYDLALEYADKAIEIAPQQSLNYTLRARIHESKEDLDAAVTDLNEALKIEPRDPFALLARARVNYLRQELEQARNDVDKLIQRQPGSGQAILLRSMIAAAERRFNDAISDLQKILRQDPTNLELQLQLASFYMADERPRKAVELLTELIDEDEGNWMALRTRADALLSIGNHADAIKDYETALKLRPEDDGILNNLAWVLSTSPKDDLRDGNRSIELALKACEVTEYKKPHILSTLAAAYAETGDFDSAIEWSSKAVELGKTELENQVEQLEQELDSYKEGKPWRELQEVKEKAAPPRRTIDT